jgi:hypothetical protein
MRRARSGELSRDDEVDELAGVGFEGRPALAPDDDRRESAGVELVSQPPAGRRPVRRARGRAPRYPGCARSATPSPHGLRHPAGSSEQPLDRGGVELGRRHALLGRSARSLESEDKALHAEAVAVLGLVAADDGDPVLAVRRLAQALEGARGWVGLVLDVAGEVESVLTECRSGRGDTRYEAGLYLGMGAAAADSGPIGWRGPGDAAPGPRRVGLRTRLSSSSRP